MHTRAALLHADDIMCLPGVSQFDTRPHRLHSDCLPSVQCDGRSVDIRTGAAGEEDGCASNVLGTADAMQRDCILDELALGAEGLSHHCKGQVWSVLCER